MTIQRAIVKGTLASIVQVRNMFTADVTPAGGDTAEILWETYLESIYTPIESITMPLFETYSYELQDRVGEQWQTFTEVSFTHQGNNLTQPLPNAVACVLIAKAAGVGHLGRKFFSGLSEGSVEGNALIAGSMVYAASALLAYITPATGLGSGVLIPGVTDSTGNFHEFVGGMVSSLLGSMRRRKPGNGI